jgi:acyl dehydratase
VTEFDRAEIGDIHAFGAYRFTADEIKGFAAAYDPQRFHLDEAAAAATHFGRLCASGWHTSAVMMRLFVDYFQRRAEAAASRGEPEPPFGPSPGFDDLKWLRPVYPGDTIAFAGRVSARRLSRSRPGWGILTMEITGVNQDGVPVFSLTGSIFAPATRP